MTPAPTPEGIRETVRQVLARDHYDLDNSYHPVAMVGRLMRWVRWLFREFQEMLEGAGLPIPSYVFWTLIALVALALLAWWIIRWRAARIGARMPALEVEPEIEDLPTDVRLLLQRSGELAQEGNYVDASRMLYRAALLRLEEQRGGFLRRGLTNSEYIRTFRSPWVIENLRVFSDLINWKWYRDRNFEADDYRRCRDAYDRLDARLREGA